MTGAGCLWLGEVRAVPRGMAFPASWHNDGMAMLSFRCPGAERGLHRG